MHPIVEVLRDHGADVEVFSSRYGTHWGPYVHSTDIESMTRTPWLVAGSVDAGKLVGQRLVYLEHGAGQTYPGDIGGVDNAGYSDGPMLDAVLFLCPNLYVMNRRQERHPDVPAYLVGVPKMDAFYGKAEGWHAGVWERTVAMTFHWNGHTCAEAETAFDHYQRSLNRIVLGLRREGVTLVGHGHPRIRKRLQYHYERHGIEWWDHDQVLYEAAALCVDNSSIGYEFASLQRPTVWMNAPKYRRHVHHGLRFWEYVPGPQVDDPGELVEAVVAALDAPEDWAEWRDNVIDRVYPLRDGHAALRSAMAIETML